MFAADPFITVSKSDPNELLIFYEHYPWRVRRGRIDCVAYRASEFGGSQVVLDSPHHLSYPHVIDSLGERALIPEHSAARDLSLYRFDEAGNICSKQPLECDVPFVDSTILFHHEKFWLFATHAGKNDNVELFVYFSDELFGPWKAHGQNPVKADRSSARPAGSFIRHRGGIFRPAQDCTTHYGSGIVVNEVTLLTEEAFVEKPVSEIRPLVGSRYDYGLHTISSVDGHTAIDGARLESTIHPVLDRLGHFVKPRLR